jgi:hypothetical protein
MPNLRYLISLLTLLEEHTADIQAALTESGQWDEFSQKLEAASDDLIALTMQYAYLVELIQQADQDGKLRWPFPKPPQSDDDEVDG